MAKETEETVGTSYSVTLTYKVEESNAAAITSQPGGRHRQMEARVVEDSHEYRQQENTENEG